MSIPGPKNYYYFLTLTFIEEQNVNINWLMFKCNVQICTFLQRWNEKLSTEEVLVVQLCHSKS